MKIQTSTNNSTLGFGKLFEPDQKEYTKRQEKLSSRVRNILASTNPKDNKGRSYVDFYEKDLGLDLYIKPDKESNSIDVIAYNKFEESFEHLYNYKNIVPKESDFLIFAETLKDEVRDFFEKILTVSVMALLIGLVFWANNKTKPTQVIESVKKAELVQSPKQIEKATTTLIKNI